MAARQHTYRSNTGEPGIPVKPRNIAAPGTNLYDLSLEELTNYFQEEGQPAYRARQVFEWIYKKHAIHYETMSNLSKDLRTKLHDTFPMVLPALAGVLTDPSDGTQKLLIELIDKSMIESVIIYEPEKTTLCISTQAGCPLGCTFCHTGINGYIRNLAQGEITAQYVHAARTIKGKTITNLVFMGMGEPFLNYRNLTRVLDICTSEQGIGISPRRITVSTSGIVPAISRFGREFPNVNLAVSLNATTGEQRKAIMPVSRKHGLDELLEACRNYPLPRRKRITFEYVLINDFNDTIQDARRLVKLLRGIRCKINLIPVNDSGLSGWSSPLPESIEKFQKIVHDAGYTVMLRKSKGSLIAAACGQLCSPRTRLKDVIR